MTVAPFVRPRIDLDLHAPGALAALFGRTRAEFGGWAMTAPAPESAPAVTVNNPAPGAPVGTPPGQQPGTGPLGAPAAPPVTPAQPVTTPPAQPATTPPPGTAQLEVREGEDAAALAGRLTPDELAQMVLRGRRENANHREGKRTAQQQADQATQATLAAIKPGLVKLGLIPDDSTADPVELARQLETSGSTIREQAVELAVLRNANNPDLVKALGAGVDAAKLLDSRSFANTVASLDPTADDFGAKIVAAMQDAATRDASYKVGPAPAVRAGATIPGGSAEQPRTGAPKSLADSIGASYAGAR